jgi:hypothetical protein
MINWIPVKIKFNNGRMADSIFKRFKARKMATPSMSGNGTGACSNGGPNEILAVKTDDFREFWLCINVLMYLSGCQKKLLNS